MKMEIDVEEFATQLKAGKGIGNREIEGQVTITT